MKAKVTLNINSEIAAMARVFAKRYGTSISELVENILRAATSDDKSADKEIKSGFKGLKNILEGKYPKGVNYKKIYSASLINKFLH
jgi:hypothetical protein